MDQQAIENADRLTSVEANERACLQITDLNLMEAEANEIKGGPISHGKTVLAWARVDGVSASNHNETVSYDEADLDQFDDLQVAAEQTETVCGGNPPKPSGGGGGGFINNHNETVAEDDLAGREALADLPLTSAQAEETKAGSGTNTSVGQFPWQVSLRSSPQV